MQLNPYLRTLFPGCRNSASGQNLDAVKAGLQPTSPGGSDGTYTPIILPLAGELSKQVRPGYQVTDKRRTDVGRGIQQRFNGPSVQPLLLVQPADRWRADEHFYSAPG